MKKRIAIIIAILLIFVISMLVIIIPSMVQRNKLVAEAKALDAVIRVDEVDQEKLNEILNRKMTKGGYAVVEDAYKRFSNDLHVVYTEILTKLSDEKIKQMLTIDTYKNDGPEFSNSIVYVEQMKKDLTELNTKYYNLLTDESVLSYIPEGFDENYVSYYIKFTRKYVGENDSRSVEKSINKIIELLDKQIDILNFLKANKKQWQVTDKGLSFSNEELTNAFNDKIKNL